MEPCEACAQPQSCVQNGRCFGESARSCGFGRTPGGAREIKGGIAKSEMDQQRKDIMGSWRDNGDGTQSFMPYLDSHRNTITAYNWDDATHGKQVDRLENDPTVFAKSRAKAKGLIE